MEQWFLKERIIICTRFWRDLRDIGVEGPIGELLSYLFAVDGRTAREWGERGWNERRWTIERSLILETEPGWIRAKWFIGELFIFRIERYIYRSSQLDLVSPDWRFNYGLTDSGPTLQHFTRNFCFFLVDLFYSILSNSYCDCKWYSNISVFPRYSLSLLYIHLNSTTLWCLKKLNCYFIAA